MVSVIDSEIPTQQLAIKVKITAGQIMGSLRARLITVSLIAIIATLFLAHQVLTGLFDRQVTSQFQAGLKVTLDQLASGLSFDSNSRRVVIREPQGDPRWATPYSGTYWQISANEALIPGGLQRSRSLWDFTLSLVGDSLSDGALHVHQVDGPNQQRLMALERTVSLDLDRGVGQIRLIAAADIRQLNASIREFNQTVVYYLIALAAVLTMVLLAQLFVGLSPLKRLDYALTRLRDGRTQQLEGQFPAEVEPLVKNFNQILSDYDRHVERARTLAGNLAHAVKTPLAVMSNAAADSSVPESALRETVKKYTELSQEQVNWHLKRSRMAADIRVHRGSVGVEPVVQKIFKVMRRAFADKELEFNFSETHASFDFKGESQDLLEMLGNLIENAAKWAHHQVAVSVVKKADYIVISVEDDGPGVEPSKYSEILRRGVRMDERAPGSGLGLAIVSELVGLYGGQLDLSASDLGGLSVKLSLPCGN